MMSLLGEAVEYPSPEERAAFLDKADARGAAAYLLQKREVLGRVRYGRRTGFVAGQGRSAVIQSGRVAGRRSAQSHDGWIRVVVPATASCFAAGTGFEVLGDEVSEAPGQIAERKGPQLGVGEAMEFGHARNFGTATLAILSIAWPLTPIRTGGQIFLRHAPCNTSREGNSAASASVRARHSLARYRVLPRPPTDLLRRRLDHFFKNGEHP